MIGEKPQGATEIDAIPRQGPAFSICTLVTDHREYNEMLASFRAAGFTDDCCEYLYLDNSLTNKYDAYAGINRFLQEARGELIILCHQDVLLPFDTVDLLRKRLAALEAQDPTWGLAGNAGGAAMRQYGIKITQGSGQYRDSANFPLQVKSLDENFIVVKRQANLALSRDLHGFHLYGTELCMVAQVLGYAAYAIDFHLLHKSPGNPNSGFYILQEAFIRKYTRIFRGGFIQTTITSFYVSGSPWLNSLLNSKFMRFWIRHYYRSNKNAWVAAKPVRQ